jgi:putative hydrolase of the HAD superfamily
VIGQLPKAILFDLDDTILTEGERPTLLLLVAERLAGRLQPLSPAQVADEINRSLAAFWASPTQAKVARLGSHFGIRQARELVIKEALQRLNPQVSPELAREFSEMFSDVRTASSRLFDGAKETLDQLRRRGVRLALVTNGAADIQRAKLDRFALTSFFDHIQIEGEHRFGKPEEQAYHHAMSALSSKPDETWMVGDNLEWEVAAPQRLGIYAIWHDHLGLGLPAGHPVRPDRTIQRIAELLR